VARVGGLRPKRRRALVAIAGAPGSGKSTLAERLVQGLGARAALVPMDGFHLDNRVLGPRGLLPRKGAPESFDAAGFVHMVGRLATEEEVMIPVFDRDRDIAISGAAVVGPDVQVAVIEGNYLLLDEAPWSGLQPLWDVTVMLDVPMDELRRRLVQRWIDHDHTPEQAEARALSNDLPNAERVVRDSVAADLTVTATR